MLTPGPAKHDAITPNSRLDASLIGGGSVSNTEFDYLNGVSSPIQTQLDAKTASLSTLYKAVLLSNEISIESNPVIEVASSLGSFTLWRDDILNGSLKYIIVTGTADLTIEIQDGRVNEVSSTYVSREFHIYKHKNNSTIRIKSFNQVGQAKTFKDNIYARTAESESNGFDPAKEVAYVSGWGAGACFTVLLYNGDVRLLMGASSAIFTQTVA